MELHENGTSPIPSKQTKFKWQYLAAFTCSIALFGQGAIDGWYSPSLAKLLRKDNPISLSSSTASWLASISPVGSAIGSVSAVFMVDRIGRHRSILIGSVPSLMAWILIASATNVAALFVGRLCCGIYIGLTLSIVPIYLGEISSTHLRGTFGIMTTIMICLGAILDFAVGPHISISNMALINVLIPIVLILSFWKMPESPYFLAKNGRIEKAKASLMKLRGKTDVTEELEAIIKFTTLQSNSLNESNARRSIIKKRWYANWFDLLFRNRANRRSMTILAMMGINHHFGGFVAVHVWAQVIFTKIGNVDIAAENAALVMMIVRLVSAVGATFVADRVNRRTLYAISGFLSSLCTFTVFLYFLADEVFSVDVSKHTYIAVGTIFLYVSSMAMGVMPLTPVVISEIFTTDVKFKASCVYIIFASTLAGSATKLNMVFATSWGHYSSFGLYTVVILLMTIGILVLLPETKGKTFAEIQIALGNVNASKEHEEEKIVLKKS